MTTRKRPQWVNLTSGIVSEALAILFIYRYFVDPHPWKLVAAILWAALAFGWYRTWLSEKKAAKEEAQADPAD